MEIRDVIGQLRSEDLRHSRDIASLASRVAFLEGQVDKYIDARRVSKEDTELTEEEPWQDGLW